MNKKRVLGGGILLILIGLCSYFGYQSYYYVSTDNATVQATTTLLSARVSGMIVQSNIQENQKVRAGQVLLEIKPDDFQNHLEQVKEDQRALRADLEAAKRNYQRTLKLVKTGASTQERLDAVKAQYHNLEHRLGSTEAVVKEAKLDLKETQVVAPADGQIARKSFEVGMMATMGQPLVGFVSGLERWIVANLKETEMVGVSIGKKAIIRVDALPHQLFEGIVKSVSPTTGALFSLLPPDNATGNFTKVVQRIPVRIDFVGLTDEDREHLQAGLSADIRIRVRE